jgi:hypothetical protein
MTNFELGTIIIGGLTALIAIYGAGLSTYMFIAQQKSNQPQINVNIKTGNLYYANGDVSENMIFITASNIGLRPVSLLSMGILMPNKRYLTVLDPDTNAKFPHDLPPGQSHDIWVKGSALAKGLKGEGLSGKIKLIGFYGDGVGTRHKSKPFRFNIESWLESNRP